jgi:membrane protease subunit HflK
LTEYKKAPVVTRERMFLETMERVLAGTDKIIIDSSASQSGVVPYLPLTELNRGGASSGNAPAVQQQSAPPSSQQRSNNGSTR